MSLTYDGEYGRFRFDSVELRVDDIAGDNFVAITTFHTHRHIGMGDPTPQRTHRCPTMNTGMCDVVHNPLDGSRWIGVGCRALVGQFFSCSGLMRPFQFHRGWSNWKKRRNRRDYIKVVAVSSLIRFRTTWENFHMWLYMYFFLSPLLPLVIVKSKYMITQRN